MAIFTQQLGTGVGSIRTVVNGDAVKNGGGESGAFKKLLSKALSRLRTHLVVYFPCNTGLPPA